MISKDDFINNFTNIVPSDLINSIISKLYRFFTNDDINKLNILYNISLDTSDDEYIISWTEQNIKNILHADIDNAFDYAARKNSDLSIIMFNTCKVWCTILSNDYQYWQADNLVQYKYYGLPFFKSIAIYYGFDNPIGNDTGCEDKYNDPNFEFDTCQIEEINLV